jgi:hypothetical protein
MLVIGSRAPDAARREQRSSSLFMHRIIRKVLTLFGPMHYAARISLKN